MKIAINITWRTAALFWIFFGASCSLGNVEPRFEAYFVKYYGEDGNQSGSDVKQTADGGYVLIGSTQVDNEASQVLLVKVDEEGNQQWQRSFGGERNKAGVALVVLADGSMVLAANSENENGRQDILLIKTNALGEEQKRLILGTPVSDETIEDLTLTDEGRLLISGTSNDIDEITDKNTYDFYFPRADLDLVSEINTASWLGRYGIDAEDRLSAGVQKEDGEFLMFGTSNATPPDGSQLESTNIVVIDVNSIGVSRGGISYYGTRFSDKCSDVALTSDGGFGIIGTSKNNNASEAIFIRLRNDGSVITQRTIDTNANIDAESITEAVNGGFVITGNQQVNGVNNIYLAKLDNLGNLIWERSFGGIDEDRAGRIVQLNDGSLVFIGTVTLDKQTKMCLIKTDSNGEQKP